MPLCVCCRHLPSLCGHFVVTLPISAAYDQQQEARLAAVTKGGLQGRVVASTQPLAWGRVVARHLAASSFLHLDRRFLPYNKACHHFVVTLPSLCGHFAITLWSLCHDFVVTLPSLCGHFTITLWSLCHPSVVTLPSLWDHFYIKTKNRKNSSFSKES